MSTLTKLYLRLIVACIFFSICSACAIWGFIQAPAWAQLFFGSACGYIAYREQIESIDKALADEQEEVAK